MTAGTKKILGGIDKALATSGAIGQALSGNLAINSALAANRAVGEALTGNLAINSALAAHRAVGEALTGNRAINSVLAANRVVDEAVGQALTGNRAINSALAGKLKKRVNVGEILARQGTESSDKTLAVATSIADLKQSTKRLNELSDKANSYLQVAEDLLDKYSVGHTAFVRLPDDPEAPDKYVAYVSAPERYRLALVFVESNEEVMRKYWQECSRADKVEILKNLPEILTQLLTKVRDQVKEVEASLEGIDSALIPFVKEG